MQTSQKASYDLERDTASKEARANQLEAHANQLEAHDSELKQGNFMMETYIAVAKKIPPILDKILLVSASEEKKLQSELRVLVKQLKEAEKKIRAIVPLSEKNTETQEYLLKEIQSFYQMIRKT